MAYSTAIGFVNPNGQTVLGPTGRDGTDHGQKIYVLRCQRCDHEYGANGTDIALRRCPSCDRGARGFEVTEADVVELTAAPLKKRRNPDWTRDELILALDVYFDVPTPSETHPEVIALSALLNRLWSGTEHGASETLRNGNGVSMKLGNFQRFDPQRQQAGRKGLSNGSDLEEEVWNAFANDRLRLKATAEAIRQAIDHSPEIVTISDASPDAEASEGAVLTRLHHYRERDRGLARKRKAQALARHGRLACEACDFEFSKTYGERGHGYIEVHHTKPLETLVAGAKTKLSDLAVLCANCHRMVHARRPWLTMDELRSLVRA